MDTPIETGPPTGYVAPAVDPDAEPFWAAVAERRLVVPTCVDCGRAHLPPLPCCPWCGGTRLQLPEASGSATLYSWIVVHRALDPAFADDVPYVVALVELAEGARLFTRLVGIDSEHLQAGQELTLTWIAPQGSPLWAFEPKGESSR